MYHAIIRYGAERDNRVYDVKGKPLLRSVTSAIAEGQRKNEILRGIRERSNQMIENNEHELNSCNQPQWEEGFFEIFEEIDVGTPTLHAEFVKAFVMISPGKTVYRIHIWSKGVGEYLRLTYDLHSESGHVISRIGGGKKHEQWLNTFGDYTIRARSNEASEWKLGTVVEALENTDKKRGNPALPVPTDDRKDSIPFSQAISDLCTNRREPLDAPPTPADSNERSNMLP